MKVCIVGGGIIGLSTALYLKKFDKHLDVTIVTEKITPDTTADGAAGIWSIFLLADTPIEKQKRWAQATHDFIESLYTTEDSGIMGISLVNTTRLNHNPETAPIWKDIVYGFRPLTTEELQKFGRLNGKHTHGYQFVTFTIEPIKILPWFLKEFISLGGKIHLEKVEDLAKIGAKMKADLVINCTGVWASKLTQDSDLVPLRGQVMRVKAPWIKEVVLDDLDDGNYVIANQDSVVLGGTHQHGDWSTEPREEDRQFIVKGCKALKSSQLEGAEFIRDWVGLRPSRAPVRLERDNLKDLQIIHNYGHGGSGITIFWGCAQDVFDLVQEVKLEMGMNQSRL